MLGSRLGLWRAMALRQGMRLLLLRRDRALLIPAICRVAHYSSSGGLAKTKRLWDAWRAEQAKKKLDLFTIPPPPPPLPPVIIPRMKKYRKFAEKRLIIPDETPPTPVVQEMFNKMMLQMVRGETFEKTELFEIFHSCKSRADLNLCLGLLERTHKFRAAKLKVFTNFKPEMSELIAKTCAQIKEPLYALQLLTKYNRFGITPDVTAAHALLDYASEIANLKLSFTVLHYMKSNGLRPNADTAHLFIKQGMKKRRAVLFLNLAKEFHLNDVQLRPETYDICLVCAANAGRVKDLMEIQQYREQYKIPNSPSTVFSLAKAHLLKHRPQEAAKLIYEECKDEEILRKYLKSMVRLWPVKLATCHTGSRKSAKHSTNNIKSALEELFKTLTSLGVSAASDIDIEKEFGAAKGSGAKYNFCFQDSQPEAA